MRRRAIVAAPVVLAGLLTHSLVFACDAGRHPTPAQIVRAVADAKGLLRQGTMVDLVAVELPSSAIEESQRVCVLARRYEAVEKKGPVAVAVRSVRVAATLGRALLTAAGALAETLFRTAGNTTAAV